jgi:hypothetical protein
MKHVILLLGLATAALAQLEDRSTDRRTFSGVRELVIDNLNGTVQVTAGTGAAVEMTITTTLRARSADRLALAKQEIKVDITQQGGLLRAIADGPFRRGYGGWDNTYEFTHDFEVRVPMSIVLDLRTVNSRLSVKGTAGEFKIRGVNGGIEMEDVEGSGSVETVNGPLGVTFARNPSGPVSFKSVNGTITASFRSGLNADLNLKTFHGEVFTDFPTSMLAGAPERRDGALFWRRNNSMSARIGSGGPQLRFETVNGDVLIRNRER